MNILLINHYAGSPQHGMEYRPYYVAREWVKMGHTVTIVAASFTHLRSTNPSVSQKYTEEMVDGIRYLWIKTPYYEGNGVGRIINMLTFIVRLRIYLRRSVRKNKYDAVIASSTYPLDIYPARFLQKKTGTRLVFEVHDLWPLSPMELGNIPAWHPYIMLMQKAENDAYHYSDAVVSILPCASDHMVEHGMNPNKFISIPNGIFVEEWEEISELPDEHRNIFTQLKKDGKFIVGYAGAHGIANALNTLIGAAEQCSNDNVAVVLVGQGPEKDSLKQEVDRKGLKNFIFLPSVKKTAVASVLAEFDVCYIGLQRQPLFRFGVSPNKLMDYMMAGKPIIYSIDAGNDPVSEAECGISIPPEDPIAAADAIRKMVSKNRNELVEMGRKGKEYVLENHDYSVIAKRFLSALTGNKNAAASG